MSKVGAVVFDIDEALYDAMSKRVDDAKLLDIAKALGVPYTWVKERYKELLEDW